MGRAMFDILVEGVRANPGSPDLPIECRMESIPALWGRAGDDRREYSRES